MAYGVPTVPLVPAEPYLSERDPSCAIATLFAQLSVHSQSAHFFNTAVLKLCLKRNHVEKKQEIAFKECDIKTRWCPFVLAVS